ncbi:kunitz-type serine protease inhibitor-like [Centruroides sculpturatus]|uniref:kunitz-type serine protease inhibitor-like n=1 Tax=Centruroides sculpturatus TaxID=218467 RepID=UPI000C6E6248|nr:kunitz-type serine protease inhibitor-like [Centruroides sculpturatus]
MRIVLILCLLFFYEVSSQASICHLPPKPGPCDRYFPKYFYNPKTGTCHLFIYGGCGGNDNSFSTRSQCLNACRGL